MADRQPPDPALVTEILKFAIASAGDMADLKKWRGQVALNIPEIVATLGEGSHERTQVERMLNCPVLSGKFLGYKLHDGSQRMIVSFQVEGRDPEDVWSERTDTPLGAAQFKLVKTFPKGCQVRIWKDTRQISMDKKVRDMLHIQRIDADPIQQSRQPDAAAPSAASAAQSPASESGGPEAGQQSRIQLNYAEALEGLTGPQRVKLAKWANETHEIRSLYDATLSQEQKDLILAHCELIRGGLI